MKSTICVLTSRRRTSTPTSTVSFINRARLRGMSEAESLAVRPMLDGSGAPVRRLPSTGGGISRAGSAMAAFQEAGQGGWVNRPGTFKGSLSLWPVMGPWER